MNVLLHNVKISIPQCSTGICLGRVHVLNSNMVIPDGNKNKDDTGIHGNINNKETN